MYTYVPTICRAGYELPSSLGKRLARQLMYRADFPKAPYETTYFSSRIVYRGALAEG